MFEKIKNISKNPHAQQLRDPRALGLLLFGVLVLLVTWSGIGAIQTNFELQQHMADLERENEIRTLENDNLRLRNEYYNTDRFLELAARRQFGLAAPGETLLLVPKEVAFVHAPDLSTHDTEKEALPPSNKPFYQKNFEAWLDFFLNRPTLE